MTQTSWQLFIVSVAGDNGALRVRLWRQLKAAGAAALRDGAYLLPQRAELTTAFENWRQEILAAGGTAYVVPVTAQEASIQAEWQRLFERAGDYQQWTETLLQIIDTLPDTEVEGRRLLRQRRKDLDTIIGIDFFGGEARELAQREYTAIERRLTRHYSPDEPIPAEGDIQRLQRADYQGRQWATRARPWVDRVASAWLIQRFIDPDAQFLWLTNIAACPSIALGFDFDDATFTHIGDRVTFEVLMASFGLTDDPGLIRLGALVHALDVDGEATPEGAGFEAILAGARARLKDDDALLVDVSTTLDSLYAYFKTDTSKNK